MNREQDGSGVLDALWITRAPGPTATGLAYRKGFLNDAFAPKGIRVECLQESSTELRRHHYDHRLPAMVREGGSIQAIGARAQGEPTKLIGLTWVDEHQLILVRPDSGIKSAADLRGKRLAIPTWTDHPIQSHQRASSLSRGMSLQGYRGALASVGLTFDDVKLVEVDASRVARTREARRGAGDLAGLWAFHALTEASVDAIYVKGAAAMDAAQTLGLVIGVDLDLLPQRIFRVNNGTPRPITVHQNLIDNHFDVVVGLLVELLRVSQWAGNHLAEVRHILEGETRASTGAVAASYSQDALTGLSPRLDIDRLNLFERQKTFLWLHGFIDNNFALEDWVDHRPLEAATGR